MCDCRYGNDYPEDEDESAESLASSSDDASSDD